MIKTLIKGKYDIEDFSFKEKLEVTLSLNNETKKLNFGDRIVYTKFYEEELANSKNFAYFDLMGKDLSETTLIQDTDSQLLRKIEKDSGDFYSADELKHYMIIALNHIMEIVTFDEVENIAM